ncbi:hypothetical protein F3I02_05450 [Bacillus sp. SRB3LM]|nr:hypothetical protein [Bacillus sp. SRB3LM]
MYNVTYSMAFSIHTFHSKNFLIILDLSHAILKILLFTIRKEKTMKKQANSSLFPFTLLLLSFPFSFYSKLFLPKTTNLRKHKLI